MSRRRLFFGAGGSSVSLAPPDAPAMSAAPDTVDGQIQLDVTLPVSWGDATIPGDGLGTAGRFDWWNVVDGWQLLDNDPSTEVYTVPMPAALWGTTTTVRVRAVSSQGRISLATLDDVAVVEPSSDAWVILNGNTGDIYGYSSAIGYAYNPILSASYTLGELTLDTPGYARYVVKDAEGNNVQLNDGDPVDAVQITFRDTLDATETAILVWVEGTARYEASNATDAYAFMAARGGESITLTGLITEFEVATLTITGTIPTTMTEGVSILIDTVTSGGVPPYSYAFVGTWPTGPALDASGDASGAPTQNGTFPGLSIEVTDDLLNTASLPVTEVVVSPAVSALAISGSPVTTGTQGAEYTWQASATGGTPPYTFSLRPAATDWPYGPSINATTGLISGKLRESGEFTLLNVRVTDALGATDDLNADFTLTVDADPNFGLQISYTSQLGSDPVLPAHEVGDVFVATIVRTSSHNSGTTLPTMPAPWVLWDELHEGTDRAIAVYTLTCTATNHTFVSANTSGRRVVRQYRGARRGSIALNTHATGTNVQYPELGVE